MTGNATTSDRCSDSQDWQHAIREVRSHRGATLQQLSAEAPTLVVFLRHAGCAFSREALADLSRQRADIEAAGARLALVHMSEPLSATLRFERHGLSDVHRYADGACRLYEAFALPRGKFHQLFGWRVCLRGLIAALWHGHGFGRFEGDAPRLAGAFVLYQGRVLAELRAQTAADRFDYVQLARCGCAEADRLRTLSGTAPGPAWMAQRARLPNSGVDR